MNLLEARTYHLRSVRARRAEATRDHEEHPTEKLYRTYEDRFILYLDDHGFEPELKMLNPALVEDCALWMRERPITTRGHRGGAQAIRMFYVVMKIWSRFLTERGVFLIDPLLPVHPPRVAKVHRKPFSEDEARRILMAVAEGIDPIRDRAVMLMLASTGCRVGELCGLTVDDVTDGSGNVTGIAIFRRTKGGNPRTVVYGRRDKAHGGRTVQALRQWLRVRAAQPGIDALFTTSDGYALETRRIQEAHKRYGIAGQVPQCTPHRWRHTHASEGFAEGLRETDIRERLGHVSSDVLKDYLTIGDRTREVAAERADLAEKWRL